MIVSIVEHDDGSGGMRLDDDDDNNDDDDDVFSTIYMRRRRVVVVMMLILYISHTLSLSRSQWFGGGLHVTMHRCVCSKAGEICSYEIHRYTTTKDIFKEKVNTNSTLRAKPYTHTTPFVSSFFFLGTLLNKNDEQQQLPYII
jgi:hypothetical protein